MKNIGSGPALDIHIKDCSLEFSGGSTISYAFECQNILEPNEFCQLYVKRKVGEEIQSASRSELAQLEPISAERTLEVKMSYKNAVGKVYNEDTSMLGKGMLQRTELRI